MGSKTFLFLALGFVVVLISLQIAAARNLDDSQVEDAKYGNGYGGHNNRDGRNGYNYGSSGRMVDDYSGSIPTYHRSPCTYGCCGGSHYVNGGCKCCSTSAEATAYKQASEAQTHN